MKSQIKLETVKDDGRSPTTIKKEQRLRFQELHSTSQDEGDTDIETPLSSPERDIAIPMPSLTGSGPGSASGSASPIASSTADTTSKQEKEDHDKLDDTNAKTTTTTTTTKDAVATNASSFVFDTSVKEEEEDYSNWPLCDIKDPHGNDVLYGRGGGTNHHPGNKRYRKLVEARKVDYVNSKRLDKPLVALEIIKEWRSQVPSGRFLKIDDQTGLWQDVGDRKAREKTSQALREKAPLLRKQQEEQRKEKLTQKDLPKNTRFNVPDTNTSRRSKVDKNLSRVMLARDHSLGRDYIPADEPVSVKGFSWTAPVLEVDAMEEDTTPIPAPIPIGTTGTMEEWENPSKSGSWEDRLDSEPSVSYDGHGHGLVRGSRQGSGSHVANVISSPSPTSSSTPYVSTGGSDYSSTQDVMPPPSYSNDWQHQQYQHQHQHNPHTPKSNQALMNEWRGFQSEDLSRKRYSTSATSAEQELGYRHSRSADDAFRRSSNRGYYHTSTSMNPSVPAPDGSSHLQSGDYERFATVVGSNVGAGQVSSSYMHSWTNAATPNRSNSESMYKRNRDSSIAYDTSASLRSSSAGMYDAASYHSPDRMSVSASNAYRLENNWTSPPHAHAQSHPHATTTSAIPHPHTSPQSSVSYYNRNHPLYRPNATVTTTSPELSLSDPSPVSTMSTMSPVANHNNNSKNNNCMTLPRPPTVKRDTSHKLETIDVEPTTKRMNRQSSIGHRTTSMSSVEEVNESDMNRLNSSLEQSSLAGDGDGDGNDTNDIPTSTNRRPQALKESDRLTTIDRFIVDLDGKSSMLDLGLKDQGQRPSSAGSLSIGEVITTTNMNMNTSRPIPLSGDDRISTLGTIDSDLFSGLTNAAPV